MKITILNENNHENLRCLKFLLNEGSNYLILELKCHSEFDTWKLTMSLCNFSKIHVKNFPCFYRFELVSVFKWLSLNSDKIFEQGNECP